MTNTFHCKRCQNIIQCYCACRTMNLNRFIIIYYIVKRGGRNMSGNIVVSIFTYVLAVAIGFFVSYLINKLKISKANVSAAKIIDDATAKADTLVKEAILDAKTEVYELKLQAEKEAKEQREEINE